MAHEVFRLDVLISLTERAAQNASPEMQKAHPGFPGWAFCHVESGGVLLSHTLASAVPSALEGLASGFGMGPGVPHSATTTDNHIEFFTFTYRTHHPTPCGLMRVDC